MADIRPMTLADLDGVVAVVQAANADADTRAGREPTTPSDEQQKQFRAGMRRFVERDGPGAWVAVDGDSVVGMAEAIRRDAFWGLAMLFVAPARQNQRLGRRLLDAALTSGAGADVRMILTSADPRALRRYSMAGFAIHPAVEAGGRIDRSAIPADLPGRSGNADDLDLVADVDAALRGSRAEDVGYVLTQGATMEIVDSPHGRGYAVTRRNRLLMLGATDDATAAQVLWRALHAAGEDFEIWGMTAGQDWAVKVALAARLRVVGAGPLFVQGLTHPPGPWIASGWYF